MGWLTVVIFDKNKKYISIDGANWSLTNDSTASLYGAVWVGESYAGFTKSGTVFQQILDASEWSNLKQLPYIENFYDGEMIWSGNQLLNSTFDHTLTIEEKAP